jgi:nickel transport system substrate-binding protein
MKFSSCSVLTFLVAGARQVLGGGAECNSDTETLDFILVEGDANLVSIEDDIRANLDAIGLKVKSRLLSKEEFNEAQQTGDFHLSFSETWGSPYDPHSYASGWIARDEGHNQAFSSFDSPSSRDELFEKIERVLQEEDHKSRSTQWEGNSQLLSSASNYASSMGEANSYCYEQSSNWIRDGEPAV